MSDGAQPSTVGRVDRLHPRPQHADRHRLVHAADHLRLRHLARHARFHRRRLVDADQPGQLLPAASPFSNDVLVVAVVVALTFLMWLTLRETFGAKRRTARAPDHVPALCLSRHLVDRLRLRLLVEPDLGRGGDAHRASPACRRTRATPAPPSRHGSTPCAASSTTSSPGRTAR